MENILNKFCENLQSRNCSKNTIVNYKRDIEQFLDWMSRKNIGSVSEVKTSDMIAYSEELAKSYSPRSMARKITSAKSFFAYCKLVGMCAGNPVEAVHSPKIPYKAPVALSQEQASSLIRAANTASDRRSDFTKQRDVFLLNLILNCGLRRHEVVEIAQDDVNIGERSILIHGKGNKERIVYLNQRTFDAYLDYLEAIENVPNLDGALFISKTGRKMQDGEINQLVRKTYKLAGIDDSGIAVHTLRKTCATLMYKNGVDIKTIRDVLGHSSVQTTMGYVGIDEQRKSQACRKELF